MADSITVALPDDLSAKVRLIAESTNQSVEQVVLSHLQTLSDPLPVLPQDVQDELNALQHLSDDTLWTIARDQLPETVQTRASDLMQKNNQHQLTKPEQTELDQLVIRADHLMLRKAEAATILRQRGHQFTQSDFQPKDD